MGSAHLHCDSYCIYKFLIQLSKGLICFQVPVHDNFSVKEANVQMDRDRKQQYRSSSTGAAALRHNTKFWDWFLHSLKVQTYLSHNGLHKTKFQRFSNLIQFVNLCVTGQKYGYYLSCVRPLYSSSFRLERSERRDEQAYSIRVL